MVGKPGMHRGRPRTERTDIRPDVTPAVRTEAKAPIRERKRKGGGLADKFEISAHMIPKGSSYEWKRELVYGKNDPSYDVMLREQGWEPVDVSRHPEFMPGGYKGAIRRDGMILMERPTELTEEARREDQRHATEVVRIKEQQLGQTPAGTLPRERDGKSTLKISKSYEPVPIDD